LPLIAKAEGRAQGCMRIVAANALAREGRGSAAVEQYQAAAPLLPELETFLELAKKRALQPPASASPAAERPPRSADEAAAQVMRLVRQARPKTAADVATRFLRSGEVHEALEVATVTALVRAERTAEALQWAAKLPPTDAFQKVRAWALAKADKLEEARDLYAALANSTGDPALRAEASFFAAFSAYEDDDLDGARAAFLAALPKVKDTPWEASARWYLALCDLLRGRSADAVPTLEALVKDLPSDRELLKHRYWLARARIDSADAASKKRGAAELLALANSDPIDFYGLLARRRLGKKPIAGARVAPDAVARLAREDGEAPLALLLWNVGLDDEARTVARGLGETAADIGVQHRIGDAHFGWRRGARFIPFPRTRNGALVSDPRWRVSFASPWREAVEEAAKKHAVPPSFIYAIMRTESGFDPRAVSVAGAQGVIQLLPSAARGSCRLAGRPIDDAKRIFEPTVAVDLGAALLGKNKEELGSLLLAAAAYNGGAWNVARWMKDYGGLELELFIERMPFKETRDYVKRVLAVEATYRALEGGELQLELPASIPPPPTALTHFPMDE
jgi:soluble lytic murein transglycosylase